MRMRYYLKVFFFSVEFAFLVLCLIVYLFLQGFVSQYFSLPSLNDNAIQWVMLFPIGIAVWTLKEGGGVLFPSEKNEKILHEWPEYWKLKIHFDVGIFNSIFFTIPCLIVWLLDALNTLAGLWIFTGFAGALSINAFSFYTARISLRSALIQLDDDNNYDNGVN